MDLVPHTDHLIMRRIWRFKYEAEIKIQPCAYWSSRWLQNQGRPWRSSESRGFCKTLKFEQRPVWTKKGCPIEDGWLWAGWLAGDGRILCHSCGSGDMTGHQWWGIQSWDDQIPYCKCCVDIGQPKGGRVLSCRYHKRGEGGLPRLSMMQHLVILWPD